jgi:TadE-like protein
MKILQNDKRNQRGQSLVEFIVVGPLAILFVLLIIQSGFLYMAKMTLNNAVFMAARDGATSGASRTAVISSLDKGLLPFYQNSFTANDLTRLAQARANVAVDKASYAVRSAGGSLIDLDILSPNAQSFSTFGISNSGTRYIPNDNLEYRSLDRRGGSQTIRDANILRIKVTYAYELKVPFIASLLRRVMCGGDAGVPIWGSVPIWEAQGSASSCLRYYMIGRVPIVSYATVQMQSPALQ